METIGFVGLGRMGKPMASNLSRKGFRLVVNDINRAAVADMEKLQCRGAETAARVAQQAPVVITMLPNSAVVNEIVGGKDGLLAVCEAGWADHGHEHGEPGDDGCFGESGWRRRASASSMRRSGVWRNMPIAASRCSWSAARMRISRG